MSDPFVLKFIFSFFVGVIWITAITIFAEKFGSKLGGAIAGIPLTMVVSLFFIGWTLSPGAAARATGVIPIVLAVNLLFVIIYIFLSRAVNWRPALAMALVFWFALSFSLYLIAPQNFTVSLLVFVFISFLSYLLLENKLKISSTSAPGRLNYGPKEILFRGVASGFLILIAVVMSKAGGPLLGGVFSSFPVLTVAMIIISNHGNTSKFTEALLKNFIITGTVNVVIFVRFTYLSLGLWWGTSLSFIGSVVSSGLLYLLVNKKLA